jgi:hypothetical protein
VQQPVSRRSFLVASAGLVAAAACGKSKRPEIAVKPDDLPKDLSLVVSSYIHTTGPEQRVTVALIKGDGPFTAAGPVKLSIDGQPVDAVLHSEGISLPYFLMHHTFDKAGVHDIDAVVGGKKLTAALEVSSPADSKVPLIGQPMISVPTPTVADSRGVNPICTRSPACPLHDVSLDAALAEKRPIALLFATPALCQSRLCGPVLDNLLSVRDEFSAKVRMLHAEIYTDLQGKTTSPTVDAYHLDSEPFLFLAGADGVVRERLDNAYDKVEVRDALSRLVA